MKQDFYQEKLQVTLDNFVQQMRRLDKAENPELVLQLVIRWTQAQPLLTAKLLKFILESKLKIASGEEAIAVETVVRTRLLREFKQNDLSILIRKLIYKKDLETILRNSYGQIIDRDRIYLDILRHKLNLSTQHSQRIENKCLELYRQKYSYKPINLLQNEQFFSKIVDDHYPYNQKETESFNGRQKILSLNEQENQIVNSGQIIPLKSRKLSRTKWLWWLLLIPLLIFLIKGIEWKPENLKTLPTNNQNTETEGICVDLTSRQSPRMSLGEKLLTEQDNNLNRGSILPLYQGTAAFARCEFSTAQIKFKESLAAHKNNPEALIYLNNAQGISQEHLKIAVSVPLRNKPSIAWEILRGVAQAQEKINSEGGINKKLLLIQIVDDQNNPDLVRQIAKQLVADERILAVVGHNDSDASLAGSEIYQPNSLVMISPTSTATELSGIGSYIFRTTPSVAALASTLADYAFNNALSKIAVCQDSSSSASSSFADEFTKILLNNGGKIVPIGCDLAEPNFSPDQVVAKAVKQKADALLLAPSVDKISQAMVVARANRQQLPLLGNHVLYTFETIIEGKGMIIDMVLPVSWVPNSFPDSEFARTATKLWSGTVNWRTAMAYDATDAIINGLKHSSTRQGLQSALIEPKFLVNGATGKFRFNEGDRIGRIQLVKIKPSDDQSRAYVFDEFQP